MTPEQLHALQEYIDQRCRFLIETRLNPQIYINPWEFEQFEAKFKSIMLTAPE